MTQHLEIDWAEVEHAYGPATDLPGLLRLLRSPEEAVRQGAFGSIAGLVMHQGSSYSAGAAMVPYLIDLFADGSAPGRQEAYNLLARLWPENIHRPRVARDTRMGDLAKRREGEPEPYFVSPGELAVCEALRRCVPTLLGLLDDEDRVARYYSAHLLSFFPGLSERISPALRARLAVEQDTVIASMLCLTAGFVGDPEDAELLDQVRARRGQGGTITRWTTLMGLARLVDEPDDELVRDLCDCLFRTIEPVKGWPFHGGSLSDGAAWALEELPIRAAPRLIDPLLEHMAAGGDDATPFFLALPTLLSAVFADAGAVAQQRAAVRVVLDSGLIEHPAISRMLRECGLPGDEEALRSYAAG